MMALGALRRVFAMGLLVAGSAFAEDVAVYLSLEEAPGAVFPEADSFERKDVEATPELVERVRKRIGRVKPTIWEPFYITYVARKGEALMGYAIVCEEIGKHRPITFIVGVTPEGAVQDVAIMMYREPVGDEVRYRSFLKRFEAKDLDDPILPRKDIPNISGATLSVRAMSRGVRKALAVVEVAFLERQENKP